MNTLFTVEECNLVCIFAGESREEVMEDINRALPYLDDKEMEELSRKVLEKLQKMTNEEFAGLEFAAAD